MEPKYLLGIDGGSSSTEFALADLDLNIVKSLGLESGTNPWYAGLDQVLEVLTEGLSHFNEYREATVQCLAGISGCMSENIYSEPIRAHLAKFCANSGLVGDLITSFRAASSSQSGVIALLGSGSSVVNFHSDGSYKVWDGVLFGGKDIGYIMSKYYSRLGADAPEAKAFLEKIAPALKSGGLRSVADHIKDTQILHIVKHLASLDTGSSAFAQLRPPIDIMVDRCVYKISGIVKRYKQIEKTENDKVQVILSGTIWNFAYLRDNVTNQLIEDTPELDIVFAPKAKPVLGALKMARDKYRQSTTAATN